MSASRTLLIPASWLFAAASSSRSVVAMRAFSSSSVQNAITKFAMPAMSPTMTWGGIAAWKVKEGQAFSAGDVLLEIETDKATMDVEAQDDGVLAKIVVQDGAKPVDVGRTIAMLAEEGDDIANVEVAKDDAAPAGFESSSNTTQASEKSVPAPNTQAAASTPAAAPSTPGASSSNAHHNFKGPLFPSVQRLIAENHIEDAASKIRGTGVRGMMTKGDVLAFLGKAKTPTGSFKEPKGGIAVLGPSQANPKSGCAAKSKSQEPLTGDALRSLIIGGLASSCRSARSAAVQKPEPVLAAQTFAQQAVDSALEGYAFSSTPAPAAARSGSTRKEGIRSDDPLWDLI